MKDEDALLVAKLQRFYGGDPLAWADMPALRLKGFIEAMPSIDADERAAYITDTAVATGSVKQGFAKTHMRRLNKMAAQMESKQHAQPSDLQLAAVGIEVKRG